MSSLALRLKTGIFRFAILTHNLAKKNFEKPVSMIMVAQLLLCISGQFAYAATDAKTLVSNLVSVMISIFRYVGMAMIAWGIIQFLLAIKKSDSESKSEAVTTAVVGIALVCLATLVKALGIEELNNVSNDKL